VTDLRAAAGQQVEAGQVLAVVETGTPPGGPDAVVGQAVVETGTLAGPAQAGAGPAVGEPAAGELVDAGPAVGEPAAGEPGGDQPAAES
jgi:hypothetical protein